MYRKRNRFTTLNLNALFWGIPGCVMIIAIPGSHKKGPNRPKREGAPGRDRIYTVNIIKIGKRGMKIQGGL